MTNPPGRAPPQNHPALLLSGHKATDADVSRRDGCSTVSRASVNDALTLFSSSLNDRASGATAAPAGVTTLTSSDTMSNEDDLSDDDEQTIDETDPTAHPPVRDDSTVARVGWVVDPDHHQPFGSLGHDMNESRDENGDVIHRDALFDDVQLLPSGYVRAEYRASPSARSFVRYLPPRRVTQITILVPVGDDGVAPQTGGEGR